VRQVLSKRVHREQRVRPASFKLEEATSGIRPQVDPEGPRVPGLVDPDVFQAGPGAHPGARPRFLGRGNFWSAFDPWRRRRFHLRGGRGADVGPRPAAVGWPLRAIALAYTGDRRIRSIRIEHAGPRARIEALQSSLVREAAGAL